MYFNLYSVPKNVQWWEVTSEKFQMAVNGTVIVEGMSAQVLDLLATLPMGTPGRHKTALVGHRLKSAEVDRVLSWFKDNVNIV